MKSLNNKINILLGFNGLLVNLAFSNNKFTKLFHSNERVLKVPTYSLPSPYSKQRDFSKSFKIKNAKTFYFRTFLWARKDLNLRPADYESAALTN